MSGESLRLPFMPASNVPTKTALGQDELRLRKHRLGQRHRTILLLVDGRRPLAEVLSLAQQAGSQTTHFEELVRLGMVELPAEAAAPEPVITEPGALDALRVTDVEVAVPVFELPSPAPAPAVAEPSIVVEAPLPPPKPPMAPAPAPVPEPAAPGPAVEGHAVALEPARSKRPPPVAVVEATGEPDLISSSRIEALAQLVSAASKPRSAPSSTRKTPPAPKPAKAAATVKTSQSVSPPLAAAKPKTKPAAAKRAAPPAGAPAARPKVDGRAAKAAPAVPEPADNAEEALIGQVRELLRQTLHYDPPSFGSKLYSRVSHAATVQELVDLAWEFERQSNHPRRSRAGMWTLQHARELLGLGNTLVQESWEQDTWQDTRPPADGKG